MENIFGKKITISSLLRFTLPTIAMMVLLSLYTIVDGIFIARYAGPTALSSTNIVFPVINIILGISIMMATGGSAVIARAMGEGNYSSARQIFTALTLVVFFLGILIAVGGMYWIEPIIYRLGATEELYPLSYDYLSIALIFTPISILKTYMDYLLVTAGKPKLGLFNGILGGCTNIVMDYVLMSIFDMGVKGAALGTALGAMFPAIISLGYFIFKKEALFFSKPKIDIMTLLRICTNGSSEMVTQISSGITTYLFNILLLRYIGVDGVAAITIILYAHFLLTSVFLGFSSGCAPIISFHYGSGDKPQLQRLVRYSYSLLLGCSVGVFILSQMIAGNLTAIFAGRDTVLFDITVSAFRVFSIAFLFDGINVFTSGMFTAFSNGGVSAFISFLKSLGFFVLGIIILPKWLGITGIWLTVPFAEILTVIISAFFIWQYRLRYGYGKLKESKKC